MEHHGTILKGLMIPSPSPGCGRARDSPRRALALTRHQQWRNKELLKSWDGRKSHDSPVVGPISLHHLMWTAGPQGFRHFRLAHHLFRLWSFRFGHISLAQGFGKGKGKGIDIAARMWNIWGFGPRLLSKPWTLMDICFWHSPSPVSSCDFMWFYTCWSFGRAYKIAFFWSFLFPQFVVWFQ